MSILIVIPGGTVITTIAALALPITIAARIRDGVRLSVLGRDASLGVGAATIASVGVATGTITSLSGTSITGLCTAGVVVPISGGLAAIAGVGVTVTGRLAAIAGVGLASITGRRAASAGITITGRLAPIAGVRITSITGRAASAGITITGRLAPKASVGVTSITGRLAADVGVAIPRGLGTAIASPGVIPAITSCLALSISSRLTPSITGCGVTISGRVTADPLGGPVAGGSVTAAITGCLLAITGGLQVNSQNTKSNSSQGPQHLVAGLTCGCQSKTGHDQGSAEIEGLKTEVRNQVRKCRCQSGVRVGSQETGSEVGLGDHN
jgi:hypothetical protein